MNTQTTVQIIDREPRFSYVDMPKINGHTTKGRGLKGYMETAIETLVAQAKELDGENLDFLIFISADWEDLVFSNQDFFHKEINAALEKAGVSMRVQGCRGGSNKGLRGKIRETFPQWDGNFYISWYVLASGCLYRVKSAA